MRPVVLGSFLAAAVAFVIGFLFWGVAPISPFLSAPDAGAAREALSAFPEEGAYLVPNVVGDHEATVFAARGGYGLLFVRPGGVDMGSPLVLVKGFLVMWLAAFLLALLLSTAVREDRGYGWRVAFVLCVGGAATVWSMLGMAVWWHLPWAFPALNVVYDLVAFAAMGAVLAKSSQSWPSPAVG